MTRPSDSARRRIDGWGFCGQSYPPSTAMMRWLGERLGEPRRLPVLDPASLRGDEPASLPDLGCAIGQELIERFACSRGQGLPDLLRLRSGSVPRLADAVARPADDDELRELLAAGDRHRLVIVPRGGGTSVTGGVNVPAGDAPVVIADLRALSGLEKLDETSGLATFGAGTTGPELESALAAKGWTLGHFPQSWELSTLGGWIATHSAGQESLGYGRIESLVAGLELVAPAGELRLPAMPASAAGPDLRQLVLGSEGRFGVITRATMRIRLRPESTRIEAVLMPDFDTGIEAARVLVQSGLPLKLLRLSDAVETEVAMTVGLADSALAPLVRGWLQLRGFGKGACLLLLGAAGAHSSVVTVFESTRRTLRPYGGAWLGPRPGRKWLADRFRHPYLRDALLDAGYATETFETAAPWSGLERLGATVRDAMRAGAAAGESELPLLCHLSHPYRDGASLYFTFFFRCPRDPDRAVTRWADLKRRASAAVAAGGGTLSHHHGVGSWHAPWLANEAGDDGCRVLRRVAAELDPRGILNPHVLLDPSDRLEG
ncbi:MAG: FAD-binding oxidoreductase [Thermoanaerobaculia bacterium]